MGCNAITLWNESGQKIWEEKLNENNKYRHQIGVQHIPFVMIFCSLDRQLIVHRTTTEYSQNIHNNVRFFHSNKVSLIRSNCQLNKIHSYVCNLHNLGLLFSMHSPRTAINFLQSEKCSPPITQNKSLSKRVLFCSHSVLIKTTT